MIYVIQAHDGPVKIGYTATRDSVRQRQRSLQTAHSRPLKLLGVYEGGRVEERIAHAQLAPHRLSGEWFRWDEDVAAFVARADANGLQRCHNCGCRQGDEPTMVPCAGHDCDWVVHDGCAFIVQSAAPGLDRYCCDCFVQEFICAGCSEMHEGCECPEEVGT